MTDNEIMRALKSEIRIAEYVDNDFTDNINIGLLKEALDLINRQKAEIERLQKEANLVSMQFQDIQERQEESQAEIKRLKEERDMAVKDIYCNTKCFICKNMPSDGNMEHCPNYSSCGLAYIHFKWRGENND